jgi:hypothetical protein
MHRTFQGRTDEVLIFNVTPFVTDVTDQGTTMVRSIMAVKLDTRVLRTYEESIFYPKGPKGKVIRVVQNKTNNAPGMIGFEFSEIK